MPAPISTQCPQCETPTPASDGSNLYPRCEGCGLPLSIIAGKYQLCKIIGQGGYGTVFLARHMQLPINPMRAIKFLPHQEAAPNITERFQREIELTAGISQDNEHIVRVFDDFGEIPGLGNFYVMELLDGEHLYHFIRKQEEPLPLAIVIDIALQLCSGLRSAHEAGVIHRDLKPENIFLIQRREQPFFVKIMDFGIAMLHKGKHTHPPQEAMGTPHYMSPEQISASDQDHRADIYAFGALLFELLVGHPPFYFKHNEQMSTVRLLEHHLYIPPRKPSSLRQAPCPPELDDLVHQCMAKDPDERPALIEDIRKSLFKLKSHNRPNRQERAAIIELISDFHNLPPDELYMPYHTTPNIAQSVASLEQVAVVLDEIPVVPQRKDPAEKAKKGHTLTKPRPVEEPKAEEVEEDEESGALFLQDHRPLYALLLLALFGILIGWWWWADSNPGSPVQPAPPGSHMANAPKSPGRQPATKQPAARQPTTRRPVIIRRPLAKAPRSRPQQKRPTRRRSSKTQRRPPKRRRVVAPPQPPRPLVPIKTPVQTPGCPQDAAGSRWIRLDLHPRSTRVQTNESFLQRQGWICLQQKLPARRISLKLTARQHQPCVFRAAFKRRRIKMALRPYSDDIALDASLDYCKQ